MAAQPPWKGFGMKGYGIHHAIHADSTPVTLSGTARPLLAPRTEKRRVRYVSDVCWNKYESVFHSLQDGLKGHSSADVCFHADYAGL